MGINPPKLGDPLKVLEVTLGCRPEEVAEKVIITPFVPLKSFRRFTDQENIRELSPRFFFKGFNSVYKDKPVTIILTGVGPSRVGDLLSILSLTPAKNVLFVGAVGALNEKFGIGDFFIPAAAADGEGYARYAATDFPKIIESAMVHKGNSRKAQELLEKLLDRGVLAGSGKVFTIGSIAFESQENLNLLAEAGFDALEMELSAFFAGCGHHGIEGGALTYVSDLPLHSSLWQEKTPEEQAALAKAWRLLPELALELI